MDKSQAVEDAVARQLEQDGHPSNELDKKMGANYKCSNQTMKIFLDAVKELLGEGTPKYAFEYGRSFVGEALGFTVAILIGKIDEKTSAAPMARALSKGRSAPLTTKKRGAGVRRSRKKGTAK